MITLLHPSRGRAKKAVSTASNWLLKRSGQIKIEHILCVDMDDQQRWDYANLLPAGSSIVCYNNKNLVEAANNGAKHAKGDIIVLLSDDFDCPENWDQKILDAFSKVYGMGFLLKTFDSTQNWIVTLPIMDKFYYKSKGYIYHPDYTHMFCDTDMTHVAELEDKLIVRNDLVFIHRHYSTGSCEKDLVNERADSTWKQGQDVYLRRVKEKFGLGPHTDVFKLSEAANPHINWLKSKLQQI